MIEIVDKIKEFLSQDDSLTYEQAKKLASESDPETRRQLAERSDVQPEVLYFLADDPDRAVRIEIAKNGSTPQLADALLVDDSDPDVRGHLATKIAKLAPGLSDDERSEIYQQSVSILEKLARDQITKVRQLIADTLKDVADAPHDIIKQLAGDTEALVAVPILELSPVLTDDDLLEIIKSSPASHSLTAICRRSTVAETVSDAIVGTNDKTAVSELLANDSAQIREETLDSLIEQSRKVTVWQKPLVRRPNLSSAAAINLAGFVADNLLRVLEARSDLDPNTIRMVKSEVQRRIDGGDENKEKNVLDDIKGLVAREKADDDGDMGVGISAEEFDVSLKTARELLRRGELKAPDIKKALDANDRPFVKSALAVRAGLPLAIVDQIVEERSAEALTALTWKADLPMSLSTEIQSTLAGIAPGDVLRPNDDGGFPFSEELMNEKLEKISKSS